MIRIKLMDGGRLEIPREEALEVLPYRSVFSSPMLKSPFEGLLTHRGKLIPLLGPLPEHVDVEAQAEDRPWILVMKGCAQVIHGLPEFIDSASVVQLPGSSEEKNLLGEIDQLLKAA